jgi:hypothetical protein
MDAKTVAIGVLVVTTVLLGGIVASSLHQERTAYGQGGVYATYLAASVLVRDGLVNFAILDSDARALVFYDIEPTKYELRPLPGQGRKLTRDFPHKE